MSVVSTSSSRLRRQAGRARSRKRIARFSRWRICRRNRETFAALVATWTPHGTTDCGRCLVYGCSLCRLMELESSSCTLATPFGSLDRPTTRPPCSRKRPRRRGTPPYIDRNVAVGPRSGHVTSDAEFLVRRWCAPGRQARSDFSDLSPTRTCCHAALHFLGRVNVTLALRADFGYL